MSSGPVGSRSEWRNSGSMLTHGSYDAAPALHPGDLDVGGLGRASAQVALPSICNATKIPANAAP